MKNKFKDIKVYAPVGNEDKELDLSTMAENLENLGVVGIIYVPGKGSVSIGHTNSEFIHVLHQAKIEQRLMDKKMDDNVEEWYWNDKKKDKKEKKVGVSYAG